MKRFSLCLLLAFVVQYSFAQKAPIKFGTIPMEDMTMKKYDADTSAAAVILTDYGEAGLSFTASSAIMKFERHVRIKILSKDGLDWANASILLYNGGSDEERVSGLKAVTYNLENGKIVETKMDKDGVFKEKFNKYYSIQKFTLPNVKEGSVIEYVYTVSSPYYSMFPNWKFQSTIPTRHSEFWAFIPDFFIYQKYMQGYISVSYDVKPKNMPDFQAQAHHWTSTAVPAFKEEPYMTSDEDYISKINFALSTVTFPGQMVQDIMGSWEKLNKTLVEHEEFGGVVRGSGFLKKYTEEATSGLTDPHEKIQAIYDYVKQNVEWDGVKDQYPGNLKKILEVKKGSSGDINFILGSMLEKAGFLVDMVLVSTRDHGFIRQMYPMRRQFNYVICGVQLDGKTLLLDATEKHLPINLLPERCLNGQGLVISKTNHGWIDLEAAGKSKTIISADLALDPDGVLEGKLDYIHDGYDASAMRKLVFKKGEDAYKKEFYEGRSWEMTNCIFENLKEIDKPAKEKHEVIINENVSVAGDAMYINPIVTGQLSENPFKTEKREYPVDFGNPQERMYLCKIAIPDGYEIEELPKQKVIMLPGNAAKFAYSVTSTGNIINVMSNFQINKSLFVQTDYANLREFYNQVVAKQTEQIVLKKKQ